MPNTKTDKKMDDRQNAALIAYWAMGSERSLEGLHRSWTATLPNFSRPQSVTTVKNWSRQFEWQDKIAEMDEEANERLLSEAVQAAHGARVDILKLFKAVVLRFAKTLKNNPNKDITSFDVATFWKMSRIEMGLHSDDTKSTHELGESFFDAMKQRHANWSDKQEDEKPKRKIGAARKGAKAHS